MVQFGFSFVESEDHFVAWVVAHPKRMKDIICSISDSVLDPDKESIGSLWTAKLITSKKFNENQVIFANTEMNVVLFLDIPNPNKMWEENLKCLPMTIAV